MPWCGEETRSWHHINRVSSCWDHLLGKRPSSRHSCPRRACVRRADGMAVAAVQWCHTGQLLDSDSEPQILWRFCAGARPSCDAMFGQDHARGPFLDAPIRAQSCHNAPSAWEDWASGAHFGPVSLFIGPEGPIAWQWSKHATPVSLPESLGNWEGSHQLHALKTCRSVLWHWVLLASNFHRGPQWQTEPVRCLHEEMSRTSPVMGGNAKCQ